LEEKILSAAAKLFAEKGFYATGMRAISAAAKVSIGAIYHHFKNKEEILERIIREEVERRVRFIQEVAKEELPLQDKVQKIVAFHFTRIDERRDAVLLFPGNSLTRTLYFTASWDGFMMNWPSTPQGYFRKG